MRGRLTFRTQVIHRSELTLIYSDQWPFREKVVFRRQSDVFPVKNEGFPAKSVTKRSLPGTKRGLSSWADGQKRCFPGECPMIDNLQKIREKHTLPGSQSAGARTISAETAKYAPFSQPGHFRF
jgi:hypothetical protein